MNTCYINDVRWFKKATPRQLRNKLLPCLDVLKMCSSNFRQFPALRSSRHFSHFVRFKIFEIAPAT